MLVGVHVKNLALIRESEVYFGEGLNILTGETGAGKSIILGSINLALGAKADKDMIRTGAEYALVELIFQVKSEELIKQIQSMDIPLEEDGTLLIQRKIMPGRSVCKVGGEIVNARLLQELAGKLLNIHGQHDSQNLLQKKKHLEILDEYAGEELKPLKDKQSELYGVYLKLKNEMDNSNLDEEARQREISLAEFEVKEIEAGKLQIEEDIELENVYHKMVHSKKILEAVSVAFATTCSEDDGFSEAIGRALRELNGVVSYDASVKELYDKLKQIEELLHDFNRDVENYQEQMEFSQEEFMETENRLDVVNHLKSKYGNSIQEVMEYLDKQKVRLNELNDYEHYQNNLLCKLNKLYSQMTETCAKISKVRRNCAGKLAKGMQKALLDLNFRSADFEIEVESEEENMRANGFDSVEFMISTNLGEPRKPLEMIASGGELSRIMLSLKTVLADSDEDTTFIFDEIDAGISGKTAWKVSEKMGVLGRNHQIICITHLPQIAAMADFHYLIEKETADNVTTTTINKTSEEQLVEELGRMLGGEQITEAVVQNARELRQLALDTKV